MSPLPPRPVVKSRPSSILPIAPIKAPPMVEGPALADPILLAKFPEWRAGQAAIVDKLLAAPQRVKIFCGPTGSGKSLIYMAYVANRLREIAEQKGRPGRALILTSSRHLQDQILRDFPSSFVFKGKQNYPCHLVGGWPADCGESAPCHAGTARCQLRETTCDYYSARRRASRARVVVTNYALWTGLSWGEESEGEALGKFDMLVCDEAHNIRNSVASAVSPSINKNLLKEVNLTEPTQSSDIRAWLNWAEKDPKVSSLLCSVEDYKESIRNGETLSVFESKKFGKMKVIASLVKKLRIVSGHQSKNPGPWVHTENAEGRVNHSLFQPLNAAPYCESLVYRGLPDVLLTSATVSKGSAVFLGLPQSAAAAPFFLEAASTFPVRNRPFYLMPLAKIDSKLPDSGWATLAVRLAEFLRVRPGRRGLLHVTSYEKGKRLVYLLSAEFGRRLVLQERGRLNQALERYLSLPDAVLISPAISEGLDLPSDKCAFNLILKTPFPDTRDPLTKARSERLPQLTHLEMAEKIEQSAGRGCRSSVDFCENYILDAHFFNWVYRKTSIYFTQSFRNAVVPLSDCRWPAPPALPWSASVPVAPPRFNPLLGR